MSDLYTSLAFEHASVPAQSRYAHPEQNGAYASPAISATATPPFHRHDSYHSASGSDGSSSHAHAAYRSQDGHEPVVQPNYSAPTYQLPPAVPAAQSPGSAALLLQQHQANQQAFRSGQAMNAQIFQANPHGAGQAEEGGSASGSGRDSSASSGAASRASQTPAPVAQAGTNGDGDFTQTFYDPFRIKHRRRTSPPQLKVLEYHFDINPKPDVTTRKALSEQLDMTPREVQVWFQNRRAKVKKLREKAEREAQAAAAEDAARRPEDANAIASTSGINMLHAPAGELPALPFPQPLQQHRTIYGQEATSFRRGSSPAVFGFGGLTNPPPSFDNPFQPLPVPPAPSTLAQPFLPTGFDGAAAYPSPASLAVSSATPSPNDFAGAPNGLAIAPQAVPGYLMSEAPGGNIARRYSLPVYNSLYPDPVAAPPVPALPIQQHLPIPPPHEPVSHVGYASSAPVDSYLDHLHPSGPLVDGGLAVTSSLDGHSPASSLGELAPSWDGTPAFPLDGFADPATQPQHRAPYAHVPPVPSQLGRRASAPAPPPMDGFAPSFDGSAQVQSGWSDHQPQQPFYGESFGGYTLANGGAPPAPLSGLPQPAPGYLSRRGSLAAPMLGTIAEQVGAIPAASATTPAGGAFINPFSPSLGMADLALAQGQPTRSPSPPNSAQGRRGSVVRKVRSTHGSLHSPYAAAQAERNGLGGGFDPAAGL
ncbi:hypothetical protein JCM10207_004347 [Rhodosporidiobolus poonsookiae]